MLHRWNNCIRYLSYVPSEEYWRRAKLPHATIFKPRQSYKWCIVEKFEEFPISSFLLIETLLAIDPAERQTATAALHNEFFTTQPYVCEPSNLLKYPPSKEMDTKLRDEEARRAIGKGNAAGSKKSRPRDRSGRGIAVPEVNAELQENINVCKRNINGCKRASSRDLFLVSSRTSQENRNRKKDIVHQIGSMLLHHSLLRILLLGHMLVAEVKTHLLVL
ncbi:unnamed protein product [Lathyrus sativus]|nr:unnamed protein product [Lathyrus sativus]